jgi:hypothetical protein
MEPIQTLNHAKIEWDILPFKPFEREPHKKHGSILRAYCCDGDGIVQVYEYEKGVFRVLDQGTYRGDFDNLHAALDKAAKVLQKDYLSIYEMYAEGAQA